MRPSTAARSGLAQARIALQPEELGEIRIHLTQTSSGLLARVTADSSAAAEVLAAGHVELRESLSSAGLSLAQLHIGHGEQTSAGTGEGNAAGRETAQNSGTAQQQRTRSYGQRAAAERGDGEVSRQEHHERADVAQRLAEGSLVDVLV